MENNQHELYEYASARIKQKKRLYFHFILLLVGSGFIFIANKWLNVYPEKTWWLWAVTVWAFLFILHIIKVFITDNLMSKDWERMRKSALHFIEKHHRSGACGRMLMNQALGNFYRERGDAVFNTGDLKQALALYMKAVAYYPFNLANDYMLLRALGEPVLSMVRSQPL